MNLWLAINANQPFFQCLPLMRFYRTSFTKLVNRVSFFFAAILQLFLSMRKSKSILQYLMLQNNNCVMLINKVYTWSIKKIQITRYNKHTLNQLPYQSLAQSKRVTWIFSHLSRHYTLAVPFAAWIGTSSIGIITGDSSNIEREQKALRGDNSRARK